MKELRFIDIIKKFSSDKLLDDAAIIGDQVFTTDILIEGTHFEKELDFRSLGSRALAVNISDIAAMGAVPKYYFVSLGIPDDTQENDIQDFYSGLRKIAEKFGVELKGGDLARSESRVVNVLVIGEKKKRFLNRTSIELGDYVYTTGKLGLAKIMNYQNEVIPRIKEGLILSDSDDVTAATDISDGLAKSIYEMTNETSFEIKVENIPVAEGATAEDSLYGGEDYELLFTSRKKLNLSFETYYVGRVVNKGEGTNYSKLGYDHFQS